MTDLEKELLKMIKIENLNENIDDYIIHETLKRLNVEQKGKLSNDFKAELILIHKNYKKIIEMESKKYRQFIKLGFYVDDILNYREIIRNYLNSKNVKITYTGKIVNSKLDLNELTTMMIADLAEAGLKFDNLIFKCALSDCLRGFKEQWINDTREKLKYDGNNFNWLKVVDVIARTKPTDPEYKILSRETIAEVLKFWIWQVKRKLFDLPVTNHFMLNLYGKQGSGKSTFVKSLFKPLEDASATVTVDEYIDNRNHGLFKNFIVFLDELDKLEKASAESIKSRITSDYYDSRVLFTNDSTQLVNKTTVIGASNRPFRDMFTDTTGFRRFIEIETLDVMDFNGLAQIDWLAAWKSVDEHIEKNEVPKNKEVLAQQEKNTTKTSVEVWLEHCYNNDLKGKTIKATTLHEMYKDFNTKYGSGNTFGISRFKNPLMVLSEKYNIEYKLKNDGSYYIFNDNKIISFKNSGLRESYFNKD